MRAQQVQNSELQIKSNKQQQFFERECIAKGGEEIIDSKCSLMGYFCSIPEERINEKTQQVQQEFNAQQSQGQLRINPPGGEQQQQNNHAKGGCDEGSRIVGLIEGSADDLQVPSDFNLNAPREHLNYIPISIANTPNTPFKSAPQSAFAVPVDGSMAPDNSQSAKQLHRLPAFETQSNPLLRNKGSKRADHQQFLTMPRLQLHQYQQNRQLRSAQKTHGTVNLSEAVEPQYTATYQPGASPDHHVTEKFGNDFTFIEGRNQLQPPKNSSLSQKFDPNLYAQISKNLINTIYPTSQYNPHFMQQQPLINQSRAPIRCATPQLLEGVTYGGISEGQGGPTFKDSTGHYERQPISIVGKTSALGLKTAGGGPTVLGDGGTASVGGGVAGGVSSAAITDCRVIKELVIRRPPRNTTDTNQIALNNSQDESQKSHLSSNLLVPPAGHATNGGPPGFFHSSTSQNNVKVMCSGVSADQNNHQMPLYQYQNYQNQGTSVAPQSSTGLLQANQAALGQKLTQQIPTTSKTLKRLMDGTLTGNAEITSQSNNQQMNIQGSIVTNMQQHHQSSQVAASAALNLGKKSIVKTSQIGNPLEKINEEYAKACQEELDLESNTAGAYPKRFLRNNLVSRVSRGGAGDGVVRGDSQSSKQLLYKDIQTGFGAGRGGGLKQSINNDALLNQRKTIDQIQFMGKQATIGQAVAAGINAAQEQQSLDQSVKATPLPPQEQANTVPMLAMPGNDQIIRVLSIIDRATSQKILEEFEQGAQLINMLYDKSNAAAATNQSLQIPVAHGASVSQDKQVAAAATSAANMQQLQAAISLMSLGQSLNQGHQPYEIRAQPPMQNSSQYDVNVGAFSSSPAGDYQQQQYNFTSTQQQQQQQQQLLNQGLFMEICKKHGIGNLLQQSMNENEYYDMTPQQRANKLIMPPHQQLMSYQNKDQLLNFPGIAQSGLKQGGISTGLGGSNLAGMAQFGLSSQIAGGTISGLPGGKEGVSATGQTLKMTTSNLPSGVQNCPSSSQIDPVSLLPQPNLAQQQFLMGSCSPNNLNALSLAISSFFGQANQQINISQPAAHPPPPPPPPSQFTTAFGGSGPQGTPNMVNTTGLLQPSPQIQQPSSGLSIFQRQNTQQQQQTVPQQNPVSQPTPLKNIRIERIDEKNESSSSKDEGLSSSNKCCEQLQSSDISSSLMNSNSPHNQLASSSGCCEADYGSSSKGSRGAPGMQAVNDKNEEIKIEQVAVIEPSSSSLQIASHKPPGMCLSLLPKNNDAGMQHLSVGYASLRKGRKRCISNHSKSLQISGEINHHTSAAAVADATNGQGAKSNQIEEQKENAREISYSPKSQINSNSNEAFLLQFGPNQDIEEHASKSYVYLSAGDLSSKRGAPLVGVADEEMSNVCKQGPKNYRSAFFEDDSDLEYYHRKVRDALQVQLQKEINISIDIVKQQYDEWSQQLQIQFRKSSPHKKTIVFDLDETLVRAQREEFLNGYDSVVNVIDPNYNPNFGIINREYFIYIKFRPHLVEMLSALKEHYELILFTAAQEQYANVVLDSFKGHQYFDHILSRKQCLFVFEHQVYVKDLNILLNGRSLSDIVIVDNKIESYASNLENGIPITDFIGQDGDQMLETLLRYLLKLQNKRDVRKVILRDFFLENVQEMRKAHYHQRHWHANGEQAAAQMDYFEDEKDGGAAAAGYDEDVPLSEQEQMMHAMDTIQIKECVLAARQAHLQRKATARRLHKKDSSGEEDSFSQNESIHRQELKPHSMTMVQNKNCNQSFYPISGLIDQYMQRLRDPVAGTSENQFPASGQQSMNHSIDPALLNNLSQMDNPAISQKISQNHQVLPLLIDRSPGSNQ